jgi:hypothetical protein
MHSQMYNVLYDDYGSSHLLEAEAEGSFTENMGF